VEDFGVGSTYLSLHYHLVFATKNREALLDASWRLRLYEYMGGMLAKLGAAPQIIDGVEDHVHILVGLRSTHCIADVMRELKRNSSVWIRRSISLPTFSWQEGYGAFTVSPTMQGTTRRYIANQEEHHKKVTSRDELIALLDLAGEAYDPAYLE